LFFYLKRKNKKAVRLFYFFIFAYNAEKGGIHMKEKLYIFTSIILSLFIGYEVFDESFLKTEPMGFESNFKYVIVAFAIFMTAVMLFHIYLTTYFVFTYIRKPKINNKISENIFVITGFAIVIELIAFSINSWLHGFYEIGSYAFGSELGDLILLITSTAVLGTMLYLEFNQTKKTP
jgi:hypothetical protein